MGSQDLWGRIGIALCCARLQPILLSQAAHGLVVRSRPASLAVTRKPFLRVITAAPVSARLITRQGRQACRVPLDQRLR
jgi:hypothetical protein